MWTEIARAQSARAGRCYASDPGDAEWGPIEPDMPRRKPLGRRRRVALRAVVNAILYVRRAGCPWRMLAKDFPPWQTVSGSFAAWRDSGLWVSIDHRPARAARKAEGRAASPSAGVIDSQSAKTKESGGTRSFDAGKKVKGCKRRIVTDTCGFPVAAVVHPANIQGRDGGSELPVSIRHRFPWLRHIFAGSADAGSKLAAALEGKGRWRFEVVKRAPSGRGFEVLPRRWAVERTLAWLSRNRRLAEDFEATIATARTWLFLGNVQILLRRLTYQKKQRLIPKRTLRARFRMIRSLSVCCPRTCLHGICVGGRIAIPRQWESTGIRARRATILIRNRIISIVYSEMASKARFELGKVGFHRKRLAIRGVGAAGDANPDFSWFVGASGSCLRYDVLCQELISGWGVPQRERSVPQRPARFKRFRDGRLWRISTAGR